MKAHKCSAVHAASSIARLYFTPTLLPNFHRVHHHLKDKLEISLFIEQVTYDSPWPFEFKIRMIWFEDTTSSALQSRCIYKNKRKCSCYITHGFCRNMYLYNQVLAFSRHITCHFKPSWCRKGFYKQPNLNSPVPRPSGAVLRAWEWLHLRQSVLKEAAGRDWVKQNRSCWMFSAPPYYRVPCPLMAAAYRVFWEKLQHFPQVSSLPRRHQLLCACLNLASLHQSAGPLHFSAVIFLLHHTGAEAYKKWSKGLLSHCSLI